MLSLWTGEVQVLKIIFRAISNARKMISTVVFEVDFQKSTRNFLCITQLHNSELCDSVSTLIFLIRV